MATEQIEHCQVRVRDGGADVDLQASGPVVSIEVSFRSHGHFSVGSLALPAPAERFRGSVDVGGVRLPVEEVDVTATFADEASDEVSAFRPETDEWQMCERF
jgi:hypothetical protein